MHLPISTFHEEEAQVRISSPSPDLYMWPWSLAIADFTKSEPVTYQAQWTPFPEESGTGKERVREGGSCELRNSWGNRVFLSCSLENRNTWSAMRWENEAGHAGRAAMRARRAVWTLSSGFQVSLNPVCVHAKSLQLGPTLCEHMDCSLPGSSVHGILQARMLEWVAMPSSRGSSWTKRSKPHLVGLLHWQASSIPISPPRKRWSPTISFSVWLLKIGPSHIPASQTVCECLQGLSRVSLISQLVWRLYAALREARASAGSHLHLTPPYDSAQCFGPRGTPSAFVGWARWNPKTSIPLWGTLLRARLAALPLCARLSSVPATQPVPRNPWPAGALPALQPVTLREPRTHPRYAASPQLPRFYFH